MEFTRLQLLIGERNLQNLHQKTVLVLGLGGVGGHCAMALARSGIKNFIIVDKDEVDITNLNRQIVALHSTIGKAKTDILEARIKDISPDANVIKYHTFYNAETKEEILNHKIDFICDCIDTITFKLDIIRESVQRNIPIISSMGAGNKLHPELLEISDIHKTSYDPIARVIRTKLKKERITKKIPVVYSKEQPIKTNTDVIGSTSFVPSSAGLMMASYVIRSFLEVT